MELSGGAAERRHANPTSLVSKPELSATILRRFRPPLWRGVFNDVDVGVLFRSSQLLVFPFVVMLSLGRV